MRKEGRIWNKEPVYLTKIVHLLIQFVLSLAFVNVRVISLVMLNVGKGAKIRETGWQVV